MVSKAIILAGGKGIRFSPITNYFPKCMIPILGRPILDYNVELCKKYFIDDIYICSGYKSRLIRDYYKHDDCVTVIEENIELGTAGAIRDFLDGSTDFIVMNGDSIYKIDINKFKLVAENSNHGIIMGVHKINNIQQYGSIVFDPTTFKITHFKEKKESQLNIRGYVSIGFYYFKKSFRIKNTEHLLMLETDIFPEEAEKGNIKAYLDCNWFPIDDEEKYQKAVEGLIDGN